MRNLKHILSALFLFSLLAIAPVTATAYDPPPPPPNGGNGDTPPPGGGAPIEGGMLIFVGLVSVYGLKKWYTGQNEEKLKKKK